jgi:hypothetical protein
MYLWPWTARGPGGRGVLLQLSGDAGQNYAVLWKMNAEGSTGRRGFMERLWNGCGTVVGRLWNGCETVVEWLVERLVEQLVERLAERSVERSVEQFCG